MGLFDKTRFGVPGRVRPGARAERVGRGLVVLLLTAFVTAFAVPVAAAAAPSQVLAQGDLKDGSTDGTDEVSRSATATPSPSATTAEASTPTATATATSTETPTATATPSASGTPSASETPTASATPTAETTSGVPLPEKKGIAPLAAGVADGAAAPYIYWTVEDASGNPVGGATFSFQRYSGGWTGTRNVTDCVSGTCGVVDRDNDPGEFLVKWIGSDNPGTSPSGTSIQSGGRYRIQPVNAPTGYQWVSSTAWVDLSSPWTNQTLDFGNFVVEKINYTPTCTAGYVYSITTAGQMQQVAPGGALTNLGSAATSVSYFNALGIGAGGQPVYAVNRSINTGNENGIVYKYDTTSGTWSTTGAGTASLGGNTGVSLVGGAVNLATGVYYFGGYTATGQVFKIYEYNPSSNSVSLKASVSISDGSSTSNGDMAFDDLGNLFIIRGAGTTVTIFSVTAASFQAASGGATITPAVSAVVTIDSVNGVALDANGKGYLGAGAQINSYNTPGWTGATVVNSSVSSTDLASCSSPPVVTIEKSIEGSRVNSGDQFTLNLQQSGTTIGTATTSGTDVGIQSQRIGPLPTVRGAVLTFTETASGTTSLTQYASSYRCFVDGTQTTQGNGTSGTFTTPASGQAMVCRFYNSPLKASVKIHKDVTDLDGQNPASGQGWTMGATATATTGTVTKAPTANTQTTDSSGNATWSLTFGTSASRATLTVSETQQTGYSFRSGQCVVTHLDGTTATTTLTAEAGKALTGIAPGDSVACGYVNGPVAGSISWEKRSNDTPAVNIGGSKWTVQGPGASGPTAAVDDCVAATSAGCADALDKDNRAGFLSLTGLAWGQYTMTETAAPPGFVTPVAPNNTWTVTVNAANAQAGATFGPVINQRITGTATWSKVDAGNTSTLLGGSEWTLTGPNYPGGTTVVDCVAASASLCTGLDTNPSAGAFTAAKLWYGSYTLVEKTAPVGFQLNTTSYAFTIATDGQTVSLGAITNKRVPVPSLPLTGGTSTDVFLFSGAALLAVAGIGGWLHRRRSLRSLRI